MHRCWAASFWLLIISAAVPSRPAIAKEQEGKGEGKELKVPVLIWVWVWVSFQHSTKLDVSSAMSHISPQCSHFGEPGKLTWKLLKSQKLYQCHGSLSPSSPNAIRLPRSLAINNSTSPHCYKVELGISGDTSLPLLDLIHLIKESLDGPLRIMPLTFWARITDWQPTDGIQLADNFVWPTQFLKDRNISDKNPSFQLLFKKSDDLATLNGKFSTWQKLAGSELWLSSLDGHAIYFSLPVPYCLKFSPFRVCWSAAPGFRGAMRDCSNHLPWVHLVLHLGQIFIQYLGTLWQCFSFSFSLKVDFLLYLLLLEFFGVTFPICCSFYYLAYLKGGEYSKMHLSHPKNLRSSYLTFRYLLLLKWAVIKIHCKMFEYQKWRNCWYSTLSPKNWNYYNITHKKISSGLCINRRIKQQKRKNLQQICFPFFVFTVIWICKKR